ncbi:hypothetical protein CALCODRAFT_506912 [Calocera cornea HHB12733]|uniref:Uncharacterized protein n=1 Tax=Calocera cornea HHB12733 TaxID=1353952 RepID=A0A165I7Z0_9BASI|nr:hypothetical protein CALCODRAFT_506912 [Calocera cornea HHB12733]
MPVNVVYTDGLGYNVNDYEIDSHLNPWDRGSNTPPQLMYYWKLRLILRDQTKALCYHRQRMGQPGKLGGGGLWFQCPHSDTIWDCGFYESCIERKNRLHAGGLIKWPDYPIVFPPGEHPDFVPYHSHLVEVNYVFPSNAPGVLRVLTKEKARLESKRQAEREDRAQRRAERDQEHAEAVASAKLPDSKMNDNDYNDEDWDTRLDNLLRYFNEPAGQLYCTPFINEMLEARFLPDPIQNFLHNALVNFLQGLVYSRSSSCPDDDKGKEKQMDNMLNYLCDSTGLGFQDRLGSKMNIVLAILSLCLLHSNHPNVDWKKLTKGLRNVIEDWSSGKESAEMGKDCAAEDVRKAYYKGYSSVREYC